MATAGDEPLPRALGARLRALRESRGMSLREAGQAAGLSASFIRIVERGDSEIALSRLMRLVDVYSTTVAELLDDIAEQPIGPHTGLREARRIEADEGRVLIVYLRAPPGFGQPFRLRLKPGASVDNLVHADSEFFHVLKGRPRLTLDGSPLELAAGDTAYVRSGVVHSWRNGEREALMVGAVLTGR